MPHMPNGSAIVNTGSVTGLLGNKDLLDYSLTKGGIHAFTRSLATQLIPRGIRVNAVARSSVDAAQPLGQAKLEGTQVWRRQRNATSGTAGGNCSGLCVPRLTAVLELHHWRDSADHRGYSGG